MFTAVVQAFNQDGSWLIVQEGQGANTGAHENGVLVDYKRMNVLHVACRWGFPVIVDTIVREAQRQGSDFLQSLLRTVTQAGRTPLMEALRNKKRGSGDDAVDFLLGILEYRPENQYAEKLEILTRPANRSSDFTALMHGAYGGRLEIVQKQIYSVAKSPQSRAPPHVCHIDGGLDLDFALGIDHEDQKVSRYGALLAAAASGGYPNVLKDVVSAIKVLFELTFSSRIHRE